jgi:hypothetical protein
MSDPQFNEPHGPEAGDVCIRSYLVDEFGNEVTITSHTNMPAKLLMAKAELVRDRMDKFYAELGYVHLSMQIELEQGLAVVEPPAPAPRPSHLRLAASHGIRLGALTLSAVCALFGAMCLDAHMDPAAAGTVRESQARRHFHR